MPAEFDELDQNAFTAINGDDGGIWAPGSVIVIGGAGLEVSGPFLSSGDSQLGDSAADDCSIFATLTVGNDATLGSSAADTIDVLGLFIAETDAEFRGDTSLGNAELDVTTITTLVVGFTSEFQGEALFSDGVTFDDPVVFNDDVTLGNAAGDAINVVGTLTVDEDADFAGVVTAAEVAAPLGTFDELSVDIFVVPPGGSFVLNEPMTFTTDGRIPWRLFTGGDANEQILVTDGNVIGAALSTGRQYQIDDTGAQNGDWFIFYNDTIYPLDILEPGGTPATLVTDLARVDASTPGFALLIRRGGSWKCIGKVSG